MKFSNVLLASALLLVLQTSGAQAPETGKGPSQRLLQDFASSANLRAFALQAKTRPGEGGLFYARYVANLCGREFAAIEPRGNAAVSRQVQASSTVESWHLAQVADLPRRCAGFVPGETQALLRELGEGPASNDPVWAASVALRSAAKSGRRDLIRSALTRAMEIDDPLLWTADRVWDAVAQSDVEAKRRLGFYLGGVVYSESDGLKHLEAYTALELGFCKPGLPCALDDELRLICAIGGACAKDREEKAKSFYMINGGTDEGWRNVQALVDQVRNAVAIRNVGFFVR